METIVQALAPENNGANPTAAHWKDVFLRALARSPIVTAAAALAGISRKRALEERNADAEFAQRWDEAMEEGIDEIEAAAYLSAVSGVQKPVYHQGLRIGWTVDYSHATQSMLLQARRPRVFGKKGPQEEKPQEQRHMTLEEFRKRVEEARRDAENFA